MHLEYVAWILPLAITTLLGMYAAHALADEPPREVTIRITDDSYCDIEKTRLLCSNVLDHLREVLKLPAKSRVHVLVDKTSTYESTAKVMELLQKSEYALPMGYVNFEDSQ